LFFTIFWAGQVEHGPYRSRPKIANDSRLTRKEKQAKKYPPGGGLNLFSWRKIEET
jgi:hypothetical protein